MRYVFNSIGFSSKKSVIEYVQANIYKRYKDHELLCDNDLRFMIDLLRVHQYSAQKMGGGIKSIWLERNVKYPNRSFWLERFDGTKTDFSFYKCLNQTDPLKDFKSACRSAIAKSMHRFKQSFFSNPETANICPINGNTLDMKNCHVDHELPMFDELVTRFIDELNIDPEKEIRAHSDGDVSSELTDHIRPLWIEYHDFFAKLRVISARANLTRARS